MRDFIPADRRLIPKQAKRVFQGIIFDVYQWKQEMFDGTKQTFEMLKRPDTVEVIAIKDQKIVILEQEQPDSGLFYDLPSGRNDKESESELVAAKRELLEETGTTFKNWKLIKTKSPLSKIDWVVYTFLATDFTQQVPQKLDAGEKITVTFKTLAEVKELLQDLKAKHMPKEIFENATSLEDILSLPECQG